MIVQRRVEVEYPWGATVDTPQDSISDEEVAERIGNPSGPTPWGVEPADVDPILQPNPFQAIDAAIAESRYMLNQDDESDEEDEERDEPRTTEVTWERATKFVRRLAEEYCTLHNYTKKLVAPSITAGPDGSVDIYWIEPKWNLIINVPTDSMEWAIYSGEKPDRITSRGRVSTNLEEASQLLAFFGS